MSAIEELKARMQAIENDHLEIRELVDLLQEVKSALRLFVKFGNGVKWVAVIVASIGGAFAVLRKWV